MDIRPEIPFPGFSSHGADNLTVKHQDSYISLFLCLIEIFLDHNRLPLRVRTVRPYVVVNQRVEVLLVQDTHLDDPFSPEPLERFHNHGPTEIIDDFPEAGRVPRYVGLGNDVRKVEDIQFAVGNNLADSTVDHEDLVAD